MQLGKSTKTNQFLESLKAEGEVIVEDVAPGPMRSAAAAAPISSDPIMVGVEEKIVVVLKKDGGLENMEVQGSMSLVVQKEEDAYIVVQVHILPLAIVETTLISFEMSVLQLSTVFLKVNMLSS